MIKDEIFIIVSVMSPGVGGRKCRAKSFVLNMVVIAYCSQIVRGGLLVGWVVVVMLFRIAV